jgi:hypothetical protein
MISVRLLPAGSDVIPAEALGPLGVTDASGAFVFPAVVPGSYVLRAEPRDSPGQTWLAMPLAVGGDDIDGIAATLQPGLRITARTQFEGSAPPPTSPAGRVVTPLFSLEAEDGGPVSQGVAGTTAGDVQTLTGYSPGRYRVVVRNSPSGWMFKGAMLDGVDVSLTPFDLTRDISDLVLVFTDRWSGVAGAVQGARADRATVLVFPVESGAWINAGPLPRRLRAARVDAQGRFAIRSVPPGDYYVVAIRDDESGDWRDPATLETLARIATQLSIAEGEHKTIDLPLRERQ